MSTFDNKKITANGAANGAYHQPAAEAAPLRREGKDREEWLKLCTQEIQRFIEIGRQSPDGWITRQELGKARDRLALLRRGLMDLVRQYCRLRPGEERTLPVALMDTMFADNEDGCSTVSSERLGALLSCSPDTIQRGRKRNHDDALVNREERKGLANRHWPVINRFLLENSVHPTCWLDATSKPPSPRGRPRRDAGTKTPDSQVSEVIEQKTPDSKNPRQG